MSGQYEDEKGPSGDAEQELRYYSKCKYPLSCGQALEELAFFKVMVVVCSDFPFLLHKLNVRDFLFSYAISCRMTNTLTYACLLDGGTASVVNGKGHCTQYLDPR